MTDFQLDRMFKIQGTDYDRRRKLTSSDISTINRRHARGESIPELAEFFGVSYNTIKYHLDNNFKEKEKKRRSFYPASYFNNAEQFESRVAYKREIINSEV